MEKRSYRNTASFGKRMEFWIIGQLLKLNLDCYIPLVDDNGVDLVIKTKEHGFIEVQIKARSEETVNKENCAIFTAIKHPRIRENYYFIFYSEDLKTTWIMSSEEFMKETKEARTGLNKEKRTIHLSCKKKGKPAPKEEYNQYIDNDFKRLKNL